MEYVELGKTGLMVSPLGLGLAEITRHKETETDEDGGGCSMPPSTAGPVPGEPDDPILLAAGFIFASPEVDTAIVGTHNPSHLLANVRMVEEALPIPAEAVCELRRRFDQVGGDWPGLM